ncbi:hypothetical protein GCM10011609_50820 [Lentzea pudingi]|uniref:PE family protein n=1 Tax=Lentzea pudingi TaxID=1789439 RepID=A0ABQ2IEH8_9PSEU|nr:hypothetical protein [Lentzea pudingi]GGN05423.1 hypothetical protein GCM10011609_50820 [Lentzea pudingi]
MTQENAGVADAALSAAALTGVLGGAASAMAVAGSVVDRISAGLGGGTQKFHVEKDTVLQAGKVVHDQWMLLRKEYASLAPKLRIATTDGEVTSDIVNAWNDRLLFNEESYANRILAYLKVLESLSDQLKTSAEQYGLSEEAIKASFKPKE